MLTKGNSWVRCCTKINRETPLDFYHYFTSTGYFRLQSIVIAIIIIIIISTGFRRFHHLHQNDDRLNLYLHLPDRLRSNCDCVFPALTRFPNFRNHFRRTSCSFDSTIENVDRASCSRHCRWDLFICFVFVYFWKCSCFLSSFCYRSRTLCLNDSWQRSDITLIVTERLPMKQRGWEQEVFFANFCFPRS